MRFCLHTTIDRILYAAPPTQHIRNWLILGFIPIVLFALGSDSRWLFERGFDGQILSNLAAPIYFVLILLGLREDQRLMAIVFVPFATIGEYIFSLILQLYAYKFGSVPLYVPFGHAILFSTGLMIAEHPLVVAHERLVRNMLLLTHAGLFIGALLVWGDTLSMLFGLLFIPLLLRAKGRPFYLIMGILVLYIELVGTAFGCWVWQADPLGILHTTNPPVGAFVCYVIADVLVIKIARRVRRGIGVK
jgi:hypothetical protein